MISRQNLEKLADLYGGILILGSLPDSPAASSGLQYGDVLLTVNGLATRNVADFFKARSLDHERMCLEVIRSGQQLELTIQLNRQKATPGTVRQYLGDEEPKKTEDPKLLS